MMTQLTESAHPSTYGKISIQRKKTFQMMGNYVMLSSQQAIWTILGKDE